MPISLQHYQFTSSQSDMFPSLPVLFTEEFKIYNLKLHKIDQVVNLPDL